MAPDLVIENFGSESVVLLSDREQWIIVNKPAADILEVIKGSFGSGRFNTKDLTGILDSRYILSGEEAHEKACMLAGEWFEKGIFIDDDTEAG